jgi:hypothetical protein
MRSLDIRQNPNTSLPYMVSESDPLPIQPMIFFFRLLQDELLICAIAYHRRRPLHSVHLHQRETYEKQLPAMAGAGGAESICTPRESCDVVT